MSNEEKKNSGLLKKIGIPAAVAAIILLLGLNAFSVYRYFNVKADNDKLYAQNEEYEDDILRLTTLNEQQSTDTNKASGNAPCGNPGCANYCNGTCTGDCQGNCGGCVRCCPGNCVVSNDACPWDDEAWLDKFADIIAGKRLENSFDADVEQLDADLTAENDAEEEALEDEDSIDEEDAAASNNTKKKTASVKRSISMSKGLTYSVDPTLQLYYQLISSPEYQRQLAYYNAIRRVSYVNYFNNSNSSSNSSGSSSGSHSSNTSSNTAPAVNPGSSSNTDSDPGNSSGDEQPGDEEPPAVPAHYDISESEFWYESPKPVTRKTVLKNSNKVDKDTLDVNWAEAFESANKNDPDNTNKKHTMIIYMLASDLEKNGQGDLTRDLTDFLKDTNYKPENLNVVLCVGAAEEFQNNYLKTYVDADAAEKNAGGCAMFYVNLDKTSPSPDEPDEILNNNLIYLGNLADKGESDIFCSMYEPETLTTAIDIASTNFAADEYSLIMWDHGGGIIGGFGLQYVPVVNANVSGTSGSELEYNGKGMPVNKIVEALNNTKIYKEKDEDGNPGKFKYIGFDACLMGGVETVAKLEPFADYCVASAEITSGGWDYAKIADYISSADYEIGADGNSRDLAQKVAELYATQPVHQVNNSCTDHVVACVELDRVEAILSNINDISKSIYDLPYNMDRLDNSIDRTDAEKAVFNIVHNARAKAYSYGLDETERSAVKYDYVDIRDFYTLLRDGLNETIKAMSSAGSDNIKTLVGVVDKSVEPDYATAPDNSIIKSINNLLSLLDDPTITQAYVNWLGYNNYDEKDSDKDGNIINPLKKVAGSNICGLSMYMPYMNIPEIYDTEYPENYADSDFRDYLHEDHNKDNYDTFLEHYLRAEKKHQDEIKSSLAKSIDYNKIFTAKARILLKDGSWADYYDDDIRDDSGNTYADSQKEYDANKKYYADNVDNIASTVIRLAHKRTNEYADDDFIAFKDTVNKITAVTTKNVKIDKLEDVNDPSSAHIITDYGIVIAKNDVDLADISANSEDIEGSDPTDTVDIGIYDYSRAESYMVSGKMFTVDSTSVPMQDSLVDIAGAGSGSGSVESALDKYDHTSEDVKDYATRVTSASITEVEDLMDGMRDKLLTSNEEKGLWLEMQGRITKWIGGVKNTVEAAILHFRSDGTDGVYKFYGASTLADNNSAADAYAVLDSEGNQVLDKDGNPLYVSSVRTVDDLKYVAESTDDNTGNPIPDVAYTVSFYHYVIGNYDEYDSGTLVSSTNRYMMVSAKQDMDRNDTSGDADVTTAAAVYNENIIQDDNSLYINIPITQPEYDPANLKITIEHLVAYDPNVNDYNVTDNTGAQISLSDEEIASLVYDNNSKYGYGALIESTSSDTTAVAPVYIADNADVDGKAYSDIGKENETSTGNTLDIDPVSNNGSAKSLSSTTNSDEASSNDDIAVPGIDMATIPDIDVSGQPDITTDILLPDMPVANTDMPIDQQTIIIEVPNTSDRLSDVINTAIASVPEEPKYDAVPSQDSSSDGGSSPEPSGDSDGGGQDSAPESDANVED